MAPRDDLRSAQMEDEDEKQKGKVLGARRKFSDFECPACSANNPFDEFGNNDEVLCNWCGLEFKALVDDEGNLKLKEL
jgi:transcription elongation factor Elf1